MSDQNGRAFRRRRPTTAGPEGEPRPDAEQLLAAESAYAPPAPPPVVATRGPDAPAPRAPTDFDGLRQIAEMDPAEARAMMEAFAPSKRAAPRQGQRVSGTVTRLTPTLAFVAIGTKGDASIDRVELDADVEVGGTLHAYVLSTKDGEIRLARSLGGDATRGLLDEAVENKIPVQGKVVSRNEHGFEVQISGGVRGFCPLSQIDHSPEPDLDSYIGRSLSFRVLDVRGREAVVSHRAIAEVEAREVADKALATVREGDVYDGVVTGIREFGAFVRIAAGLEGLVHLSNMSKNRVSNPADVVKEGQEVRVRVLSIDPARKRINLGIRQAEDSGTVSDGPAPARGAPISTGGSFGTFGALLKDVRVKPASKPTAGKPANGAKKR